MRSSTVARGGFLSREKREKKRARSRDERETKQRQSPGKRFAGRLSAAAERAT